MNRSNASTVEGRRSQFKSGLIAGALATAAEAVWTRAQVRLLGGRKPVFAPSVMVSRMFHAATGHSLNERVAGALGVGMRTGYGPSLAVLWTLLRNGRCPRWVRDTCLLGGLIWAFEIAALPAVRATPPLRRWPRSDVALDLSNGLVFAAVTNAMLQRLRPVTTAAPGVPPSRPARRSTARPPRTPGPEQSRTPLQG